MTEWVQGIFYTYIDPDHLEGGGTIAIVEIAYDDEHRPPAACSLIFTMDRAQAERWRSAFAAGGQPDLRADPPIIHPISDEVAEECLRIVRANGDL